MTTADHIDETDMLRVQLAESRLAEARAQLRIAGFEREATVRGLFAKYGLTPADSVQPDGSIVRAVPEPSKETAP